MASTTLVRTYLYSTTAVHTALSRVLPHVGSVLHRYGSFCCLGGPRGMRARHAKAVGWKKARLGRARATTDRTKDTRDERIVPRRDAPSGTRSGRYWTCTAFWGLRSCSSNSACLAIVLQIRHDLQTESGGSCEATARPRHAAPCPGVCVPRVHIVVSSGWAGAALGMTGFQFQSGSAEQREVPGASYPPARRLVLCTYPPSCCARVFFPWGAPWSLRGHLWGGREPAYFP